MIEGRPGATPPTKRRARAVHGRLRRAQGAAPPKPRLPPLDELILTVLSQATSDVNRDRAFAALKERFPSWDAVIEAPAGEVADALRPGGIAEVKARRIRSILTEIRDREGALDLERLRRAGDDAVVDYLRSLPGVGPKTAACVLAFSLGRPAFPVDTHVHRIALRLGWAPAGASAEQTHRLVEPAVPPEIRLDLHLALIEHGRKVCIARLPRCTRCPVFELCPSGPRLLAAGEAR